MSLLLPSLYAQGTYTESAFVSRSARKSRKVLNGRTRFDSSRSSLGETHLVRHDGKHPRKIRPTPPGPGERTESFYPWPGLLLTLTTTPISFPPTKLFTRSSQLSFTRLLFLLPPSLPLLQPCSSTKPLLPATSLALLSRLPRHWSSKLSTVSSDSPTSFRVRERWNVEAHASLPLRSSQTILKR